MRFTKSTAPRLIALILACLLLFCCSLPVFAQGALSLLLYPPDLGKFPKITLFLDAFDAQGKFIPSLDLNSFKVYEDGFEQVVNETRLLEPGLHTIVAFNLGATLSNRANAAMPTRFEESISSLADWLNGLRGEASNQYSLTSNEGILVDRLQEKDSFLYQLQNYRPNLFNFQPDFSSLALALDIAEQPNLIPHSKEAILYITPLPLDAALDQEPVLRTRAIDLRVPVNVWLMAPETAVNAPAAEQLRTLASSTGGNFFFFTEDSPAPNPEDYLGRLRNLYELVYTSDVSQSGTHTTAVEAFYGDQSARTPDLQFAINLNLPTAVIVDLPDEISRKYVNGPDGRALQPGFITLTADYLFPDGYDRQLRSTRLYVDGEVAAENREAPFEFFAWPLEEYRFSGEHLLSVEVEDILGFRSISPPVSIFIQVDSLYPSWLTVSLKFLSSGGWIPVAMIALGGSIAVGRRLRRNYTRAKEARENGSLPDYDVDPLQQRVPGLQTADEAGADFENSPDLRSDGPEEAPPRLVWAGALPAPISGDSIELKAERYTIGSDASQADFVLQSESVSPRHALILRSAGGSVSVADLGSETGTWVNFAPVSSRGIILNQGDLVQIGRLSFRYQIGKFQPGRQP